MKSKKAKEFIEEYKFSSKYYDGIYIIDEKHAKKAVELAEQEMVENAAESHKLLCNNLCKGNVCYSKSDVKKSIWYICDRNCLFMKDFISQLKNGSL